ncbi:hypothetical protein EUGRSUZ_H00208 [Eucalyptus grandis]|uniref:Uncharacterized protein n=2 Tax=Eucalyptus grandis TaxID=71139 RepID=A0ACC3JKW0_EUCGR|nr:hypothetical protein EUGRSUZ_H00208 [Eucalyptus grandis]
MKTLNSSPSACTSACRSFPISRICTALSVTSSWIFALSVAIPTPTEGGSRRAKASADADTEKKPSVRSMFGCGVYEV